LNLMSAEQPSFDSQAVRTDAHHKYDPKKEAESDPVIHSFLSYINVIIEE